MDPVRDPLTAPLTIPLAYLNKSLYEIDQAATHTPVLYPNFRGPRIMRNFPHTGGKTIHVSSPFSGVCALSPGAFFPLQRAPSLYGDTYKFRKRLCTLSPPPKRGGCLWSDSFLAHHPLPPKRTHFAPTTNSTISWLPRRVAHSNNIGGHLSPMQATLPSEAKCDIHNIRQSTHYPPLSYWPYTTSVQHDFKSSLSHRSSFPH